MVEPPVDTVAVAAAVDVIVNVVALGTVLTINTLSSKFDALSPVPLGKVTESSKIISSVAKPWAEPVVIVTAVESSVVAYVALVCWALVSSGVIS